MTNHVSQSGWAELVGFEITTSSLLHLLVKQHCDVTYELRETHVTLSSFYMLMSTTIH